MRGYKGLFSLLAIVLFGAPLLRADAIWGDVSLVSNSAGNYPNCCQVDAIYDEEGLAVLGDAYTAGQDWTTYFATNPLHTSDALNLGGALDGSQDYEWFSADQVTDPATATIILSFGQPIPITEFALWNEDAIGVYSMTVNISNDPTFLSGVTTLGTFYPTANPVGPSYGAQQFTGFTPATGEYVELLLTAPSGTDLAGDGLGYQVSMGAIAFGTNIPEPGSGMLMGLGLVAVGLGRWAWQRRVVRISR